jgi:ParB family chromosome partitioning protein
VTIPLPGSTFSAVSMTKPAQAGWASWSAARSKPASTWTATGALASIDHLGGIVGIDMARWWRPTVANYFDRVSKQVILDALGDVGGPELSSRFASVKKRDLAMSAERVFAGATITEVEVRDRALAWVPEVMRFGEQDAADATDAADDDGDEAIDASAVRLDPFRKPDGLNPPDRSAGYMKRLLPVQRGCFCQRNSHLGISS